jgi:hypothetical protein
MSLSWILINHCRAQKAEIPEKTGIPMKYWGSYIKCLFWPNPAVRLSIAGCRAGKVADCYDRLLPTYCVEKLLGNAVPMR